MTKTDSDELTATQLTEFAPYLMNRIVHRYNQTAQVAMSERGITTPKMRVLAALASQGDLTVNELTVFAVSEQSTMSRTLDQMEKSGLVVRKTGDQDSRVRHVSITESGLALYRSIWPDMLKAEAELFAGLDKKKKTAFLNTLNQILLNIRVNKF
ncbi:MarR family winged helix-turn-helix transcriptional regulator [Labrenzia sp. PHM005]|uniref:MarR family winged helix-turn-helix transcriptional regulator n=1 Tax=Stappiaceae TaxID=2821832 RepID=UPI00113FC61A|nr:MarR family transcriptional regulator [Labrenzia sp. PHM005]QDG77367.1 MarR family transcriptional regulator [Labrenzia sp. PHM005]